jgi:circadian clock protein KaiB
MSTMTWNGAEADRWVLRLYVAGQSANSLRAIANLKTVCEFHLAGRCDIAVIDLIGQPELARRDDIVAIPTLVREAPGPIRKIVGDLSNTDRVLAQLER